MFATVLLCTFSSIVLEPFGPLSQSRLRERYNDLISYGLGMVIQWLRIYLPKQGTRVHWSGKIPHASRQLPQCTATTEPESQTTEVHVPWSPRSATGEATATRSLCTTTREQPPLTEIEKACTQQCKPRAAKNKKNFFFI